MVVSQLHTINTGFIVTLFQIYCSIGRFVHVLKYKVMNRYYTKHDDETSKGALLLLPDYMFILFRKILRIDFPHPYIRVSKFSVCF